MFHSKSFEFDFENYYEINYLWEKRLLGSFFKFSSTFMSELLISLLKDRYFLLIRCFQCKGCRTVFVYYIIETLHPWKKKYKNLFSFQKVVVMIKHRKQKYAQIQQQYPFIFIRIWICSELKIMLQELDQMI